MLCDDFAEDMDVMAEKVRTFQARRQQGGIRLPLLGEDSSVAQADAYIDRLQSMSVFAESITRGQRFVLSPQVCEAAEDFSKSARAVDASLDYIFLPAEASWIEWHGNYEGRTDSNRHGLYLLGMGEGKSSLSVGRGAYVYDGIKSNGTKGVLIIPVFFDLHDFIFKLDTRGIDSAKSISHQLVREVGRFLVCVLALINTPRISHLIEHDVDAKLNRSRLKRGKVPLMSWRDVTIRPDAGWMSRTTHEEGTTGERRRHHVRTFMRLKMGKVEIVKPHWRGNREKGYVQHRHVVRMDGEEAGAWKGEPLPGPRIMKPDDEAPE